MFQIHRNPMRLYIYRRHLHHGLTGSILIAIGVILVATDWKDRPWRFVEDHVYYERDRD